MVQTVRDDATDLADFEKDRIIKVRVWAAYLAEPITIRERNDQLRTYEMRHCDITQFPLSSELIAEFLDWDEQFQATFDHNWLQASCFASTQLEQDHNKQGNALAQRLQSELGDAYEVKFKQLPSGVRQRKARREEQARQK